MASKRRGGFRPPELRGTLGTLLRTTTDVVRGALERGAREGRARLDDVRANRRRQDALAELGEVVLVLIRRGEIDLDELPEARDLIRQLDEFDDGATEDELPRASARRRFDDRDAGNSGHDRGGGHDRDGHDRDGHGRHGHGHELGSGIEPPRRGDVPRRDARDSDLGDAAHSDSHRGDVARRGSDGARGARSSDSARGARGSDAPDARASSRRTDDDGTVSSGAALRSTRPTTPARPRDATDTSRAPTKPIKGLWRPDPDAPGPDEAPASPSRRYQLAPDPHRKGGISFDADDDLADYMHPDDVPPRGSDEPDGSDSSDSSNGDGHKR